jgi:hypothetical protein
MNTVLIITYDLIRPGQNYESLITKIKAYGTWAKIGYSCYLVVTKKTPEQVRDDLITVMDSNDKLYVGVSPAPSAWYGMPDEVSKWIHSNQK